MSLGQLNCIVNWLDRIYVLYEILSILSFLPALYIQLHCLWGREITERRRLRNEIYWKCAPNESISLTPRWCAPYANESTHSRTLPTIRSWVNSVTNAVSFANESTQSSIIQRSRMSRNKYVVMENSHASGTCLWHQNPS